MTTRGKLFTYFYNHGKNYRVAHSLTRKGVGNGSD
jgi:hypothetical protein